MLSVHSMADEITRVVALGASNLTRGLHTVVSTARTAWGPNVEVLGALGHGRSYGAPSRLARQDAAGHPPVGIVADAGVASGGEDSGSRDRRRQRHPLRIPGGPDSDWVEEAVERLQEFTPDIVLTDLPLPSIRRLSRSTFLLFRSLLVPRCRLSLAEVVDTAERVNDGLSSLASARRLHFAHDEIQWYGVDPIHIRPCLWHPAWQHILGHELSGHSAPGRGLKP